MDRYLVLGQLLELIPQVDELFCKLYYDEIPDKVDEKTYEELVAHLLPKKSGRSVRVAKAGSR